MKKILVKNISDNINIKEFGKGSDLQQKTYKEIINYITKAKYISNAVNI